MMAHRRRLAWTASALALLILGFAGPASAGVAFTIDNLEAGGLGNPPFTLGFRFTANAAVIVTHFSVFDSGQDGLAESHEVGLWDGDGTLLVTGTIAAGTLDPLVNQFRSIAIPEVALVAGRSYSVGALFLTGADGLIFAGDAINFATAPEITFLSSAFEGGPNLAFQTGSVGTEPGYFGPNFRFRAVPEPSTLVSGATAILCGLGASRARRRRQTA